MVYEMELSYQGVRRRRSFELMANSINARYTDSADSTAKETSWVDDLNSQARYGKKVEAITLGRVTTDGASARRDTALKASAWPWVRPVSATPYGGDATLDVMVCGYAFTCNWKFVSVLSGLTGNVDTYLSAIVTADCPFVSVGAIRANAVQIKRETTLRVRAWDMLMRLVELGDAAGNPWRVNVRLGRTVDYEPVPTIPLYYLRAGGLYKQYSERIAVSPWLIAPGVIRDAQYPVTRAEPGSWLTDARDIFAEEVSVDASGQVSFTTGLYDESAILDAQTEMPIEWVAPPRNQRGKIKRGYE